MTEPISKMDDERANDKPLTYSQSEDLIGWGLIY